MRIWDKEIAKGSRQIIEIPMSQLFDMTNIPLSVEVIAGKEAGPALFISAALHGDEVIGTEIVRRLLARKELDEIKGTLICVPIVNHFGYNNCTRYLPDRRDLNRSFPGSQKGSLAARMAYLFLNEIVAKCQYGIDIHSGAIHRTNYPQVRLEFVNQEEIDMAMAFSAPIVVQSPNREGALRNHANKIGVKMLLFEVGEALRFDEVGIEIGVRGILSVMHRLGMLKAAIRPISKVAMIAQSSHWIRAQCSGSLRKLKKLGEFVKKDEVLGVVSDPFGKENTEVIAANPGMIIGEVTMPLINKGDALFHVATSDEMKELDRMQEGDIVFDKDIDIENKNWFTRGD